MLVKGTTAFSDTFKPMVRGLKGDKARTVNSITINIVIQPPTTRHHYKNKETPANLITGVSYLIPINLLHFYLCAISFRFFNRNCQQPVF